MATATRPCNASLRLCFHCRKRRTRSVVCAACRQNFGKRGKLHADDAHGTATPERLAELEALAAAGLPLTPGRRPADAPRRVTVGCHRSYGKERRR